MKENEQKPHWREINQLVWVPSPKEIAREKWWIVREVNNIGLPVLESLAKKAAEARQRSYSPNSHYPVGAAALLINGEESDGQNIEIVTYSESGHAEEQALKNAVSGGAVEKIGRKFLKALAVSHEGDTSPCGRCRQIMKEFSDNAIVVIADPEGKIRRITSLKILLPDAFGPSNLGIK